MTMATQDGWGGDTGLEDFDSSDVSMPRLNIDHAENVFKDSLSNDTFESLDVILLGLHKSRIMWPGEISDGDAAAPLCKSPDFSNGFPNMDPDISAELRYPWSAQDVYTPEQAVPLTLSDGRVTQPAISCKACKFKEWNTDPTGKKPWCSEEWIFPLLYRTEDGSWNPALFGLKRSGLAPAKKYVSPFATKKMPLFVTITKLTLNANKRGMVRYSTPVFTKGAATPEAEWTDYHTSFVGAKEYLKQYPMPRTDEEVGGEVIEDNSWEPEPSQPAATPPPAAAQPKEEPAAPAAPTPPAAPAAPVASPVIDAGDDDEPPF